MKKNLIALMLCLVSISFISCRNPFSSSSNTQSVNVKVSEGSSEYEFAGYITAYTGAHIDEAKTCALYVKQVPGRLVYNIKVPADVYFQERSCILMLNPQYNDPNCTTNAKKYKYKGCGNVYCNID